MLLFASGLTEGRDVSARGDYEERKEAIQAERSKEEGRCQQLRANIRVGWLGTVAPSFYSLNTQNFAG
jgi:hypothetical protein